MLTDVLIAASSALVLIIAAAEVGYFYKGRHRGEYVEKPGWKRSGWAVGPDGHFTWMGKVTITGPPGPEPNIILMLAQPGGWAPCYTLPYPEENHGRWGDSDIDRVDSATLCTAVARGDIGSDPTR